MDPVTMSLIAAGVGGGIKAIAGLFDDSAQRKADLMNKEADIKTSALEETMRRAEGQQTQVMSSTKARLAGTGFSSESSSFHQLLAGMATEFQKQNEFAQKQGMAAIDLIRQGANDVESAGNWQKVLGVANAVTGSVANIAGILTPRG